MIERIPDTDGGKAVLKLKLNEIIDHLNSFNEQVEAPLVPKSSPFTFEGFTLSSVPGYLNAPVGGYVDDTDNKIVGIIKFDRVPLHVREAFQFSQTQG